MGLLASWLKCQVKENKLIIRATKINKLRFFLLEVTAMDNQTTKFGFTAFAETWNGRLAMLGFFIGIATEVLTGQGILAQIGLM
jgi:hypothetical protein